MNALEKITNIGNTEKPTMYCSFSPESKEDKVKLYNAMNSPDNQIGDCIGVKIALKDVYLDVVEMLNETTGELEERCRVVLFDADGTTYGSVSSGIFSAVKKLFSAFGTPDMWDEPLDIMFKQVKLKKGNMHTIVVC